MTFDNQYLTYSEYQQLGGEQIGEMPFNLLEYEARKQIDLRTHKRLVGIDNIPQEVKLCMYNLINKINSYSKSLNSVSTNGNIANESIDGYSITYITANQISEIVSSKNNELQDMVMTYLYGVIVSGEHLIYTGI